MNWKGIVGTSFSADDFDAYCHALSWSSWRPTFITLHNTASPTLAQRPNGFTSQHIRNLEKYYRDEMKWKAGPHLFVDDKQIWVFTPLTMSGTHSPCFNKLSLGVEMLGDYSKESFTTGRGLKVQKNAVAAVASLSAVLGLPPESLRLHKEDRCTSHDCPGKNVNKKAFVDAVIECLQVRHGGGHMDEVA